MKTLIASLALSLAGLLAVPAAMAADAAAAAPAEGDGAMGACKADAEKLCPGVKPGDGKLKACFKEHRKELSAECKKELSARKAHKAG